MILKEFRKNERNLLFLFWTHRVQTFHMMPGLLLNVWCIREITDWH